MLVGCCMYCKGVCMKLLLDVLMIFDVLEKEGSFVVVLVKFYKMLFVLSYIVYKLESDFNI